LTKRGILFKINTREYVPLLGYSKNIRAVSLGTRNTFADIGATFEDWIAIPNSIKGRSFLKGVFSKN
jgi:phosphopentomutase